MINTAIKTEQQILNEHIQLVNALQKVNTKLYETTTEIETLEDINYIII